MENKILTHEEAKKPGHTYFDGPGLLRCPGAKIVFLKEEESLDITHAGEGTQVQGGAVRQIDRTRVTQRLWLDDNECVALQRSNRYPIKIDLEKVRHVSPLTPEREK